MTHLTAFLCPLARRGSRRGARAPQAGRNAASGQRNTTSGGPEWPPGGVTMLARCGGIALRTAPTQEAISTHQTGYYQRPLV
jgi:hypothetical protein